MFTYIYSWFIFVFYGCISISVLFILTHVMIINFLYFIKLLPKKINPHIGIALLLTIFCSYSLELGLEAGYALPYIKVEIMAFVFQFYLILDALAAIKFITKSEK